MSYVKSTFDFVVGFICSTKIMNSPKKPLLKRAISLVLWSLNHNNRWFSGYTPIFTDQLFVGKYIRKYYKLNIYCEGKLNRARYLLSPCTLITITCL